MSLNRFSFGKATSEAVNRYAITNTQTLAQLFTMAEGKSQLKQENKNTTNNKSQEKMQQDNIPRKMGEK